MKPEKYPLFAKAAETVDHIRRGQVHIPPVPSYRQNLKDLMKLVDSRARRG